tara:strand:+ start:573 stop:800 length:228 start_codon:yes stop_codon:yes gene_type:complete
MVKKGDKVFHLQRVAYGRSSTPVKRREYKVREFPTSAVGTVNEIADFIRDRLPYKKIVLRTTDAGDFRFNFNIER